MFGDGNTNALVCLISQCDDCCSIIVNKTHDVNAMLISYERPNVIGPKASQYYKTDVPDPLAMELILSHSHGILGVVEKNRTVYIVERNGMKARVHIDKVSGIGEAIEFEVN